MKQFSFLMLAIFLIAACSTPAAEDKSVFCRRWIEETAPDSPYVQEITLLPDGTASSIGMATLKYQKWALKNGRLFLSGKSIGNGQTIDFSDQWQILEITPLTMKLKSADGNYRINYRRSEK